jgi:hypothetical protein
MTTVGYGDIYPITVAGKCVAAVTMVTGLLVIAFPITIIGVNLNDIYDEYRAEQEELARADARTRAEAMAQARADHAEVSLSPEELTEAIDELVAVQQRIHEELDGMRNRLSRLLEIEVHGEVMLDHLRAAHALNLALAAQARAKAAAHARLVRGGDDDDEIAPMMAAAQDPDEAAAAARAAAAAAIAALDDDDGAGVEAFASTDILQLAAPTTGAGTRNRWKGVAGAGTSSASLLS